MLLRQRLRTFVRPGRAGFIAHLEHGNELLAGFDPARFDRVFHLWRPIVEVRGDSAAERGALRTKHFHAIGKANTTRIKLEQWRQIHLVAGRHLN